VELCELHLFNFGRRLRHKQPQSLRRQMIRLFVSFTFGALLAHSAAAEGACYKNIQELRDNPALTHFGGGIVVVPCPESVKGPCYKDLRGLLKDKSITVIEIPCISDVAPK
jgi:hypothetical protein